MELKERIKQKADELYRRYGVKSVTMDEIATQLGVSKKTIYQCFSDKNELVDAVIADILEINREFCISSSGKAQNAIHEVFLAMESLESMFANMNSVILFDIERGKKEELYRNELNTEIIAKVRLECIILPFSEKLFPQNQFPLAFLHQQLIEFFLFGMATPKGYKLITKYQKERKNVQ